MPPPAVLATLGVTPPAFVRKLNKKADWGHADDPLEGRVVQAVTQVFQCGADVDLASSVYLVRSDDDLRRVSVALNATRHSLIQLLDLVAFLPDELGRCGIAIHENVGQTPCGAANVLHHDLHATSEQFAALCRAAMSSGRPAGRCTKGTMAEAVQLSSAEQCHAAVIPSPGCLVPTCPGSLPAALSSGPVGPAVGTE